MNFGSLFPESLDPAAVSAGASGEAQLVAIFDRAAIGIGLLDGAGRMIESSPAMCTMLGRSGRELAELPIHEFTHPEDAEREARLFAHLMEGGREFYQMEKRFLRPDGGVTWGQVTVSHLPHDAGRPSHALVMVQDVTERKRAELALAESEARFRSLIENASDVVTILEADGTIRYESPAVERVLGRHPGEVEGGTIGEHLHPEDVEHIAGKLREAMEHPGRKVAFNARVRHADGSYRYLEGIGVNLYHDSSIRGIVANSRDVTERVTAEQQLAGYSRELERERALFEQLFHSSPAAVVLLDTRDRVLRVNPEFERLFGFTQAEMTGKPLNELIVPEALRDEAFDLTARAVKGERAQMDTVRRRKDGGLIHVAVAGVPVRLHGDQIAVYGVYRDITTQKAVEASLERQAMTDPLTGLLNRRGFLSVLEREWPRATELENAPLLLYADLDDFKKINDEHGHAEGDRVLRTVADALRRCFRASDSIARLGGDEFVVFAADAESASERIMRARIDTVLSRVNQEGALPHRIHLSIGAVRASDEASEPESLLAEADRRMYAEKRAHAPERARRVSDV